MGTNLTNNMEHFTAKGINLVQNGFFRNDRKRVHRTGQPLYL